MGILGLFFIHNSSKLRGNVDEKSEKQPLWKPFQEKATFTSNKRFDECKKDLKLQYIIFFQAKIIWGTSYRGDCNVKSSSHNNRIVCWKEDENHGIEKIFEEEKPKISSNLKTQHVNVLKSENHPNVKLMCPICLVFFKDSDNLVKHMPSCTGQVQIFFNEFKIAPHSNHIVPNLIW